MVKRCVVCRIREAVRVVLVENNGKWSRVVCGECTPAGTVLSNKPFKK